MGMFNADVNENRTFIAIGKVLAANGIPVPRIFAVSEDEKHQLLEDLGNTSLFDLLQSTGDAAQLKPLYRQAIDTIVAIQSRVSPGFDFEICYPVQAFTLKSFYWDLCYFKYCFLRIGGHHFNEVALEEDFDGMVGELLSYRGMQVLVHRDFQSRNLMVHNGRMYTIDFQGARKGHPLYDLISLLWQARASLPMEMRAELFNDYLDRVKNLPGFDAEMLQEQYPVFVLFRILQVLGAYGLRGLHEQRPHFIASIPHAIENLQHLFRSYPELPAKYPELHRISGELRNSPVYFLESDTGYADGHQPTKEAHKEIRKMKTNISTELTVNIQSFSFRNGYPSDISEHGGGHVFDCRMLPNPGRIERYKTRSGLDADVIHWLEEKEEVHRMFEHFSSIVRQSVEAYQQRGFSYLAVNFGCTGGQHRSVYMAERLAELLRKSPDIQVSISHLNRDAWKR